MWLVRTARRRSTPLLATPPSRSPPQRGAGKPENGGDEHGPGHPPSITVRQDRRENDDRKAHDNDHCAHTHPSGHGLWRMLVEQGALSSLLRKTARAGTPLDSSGTAKHHRMASTTLDRRSGNARGPVRTAGRRFAQAEGQQHAYPTNPISQCALPSGQHDKAKQRRQGHHIHWIDLVRFQTLPQMRFHRTPPLDGANAPAKTLIQLGVHQGRILADTMNMGAVCLRRCAKKRAVTGLQ